MVLKISGFLTKLAHETAKKLIEEGVDTLDLVGFPSFYVTRKKLGMVAMDRFTIMDGDDSISIYLCTKRL